MWQLMCLIEEIKSFLTLKKKREIFYKLYHLGDHCETSSNDTNLKLSKNISKKKPRYIEWIKANCANLKTLKAHSFSRNSLKTFNCLN